MAFCDHVMNLPVSNTAEFIDWLRFCLLPHYINHDPWFSSGGLAPIFPKLQQLVDVSG